MLITPDDLSRIDRLSEARKDDADVLWLCETSRRLAALKPTEASFPKYAAIINQKTQIAYPVAFVGTVPVEQAVALAGPAERVVLLDYAVQCDKTEAFLLVRPYLKLVSPRSEEALERLGRTGRIWIKIDDLPVLDGGSPEEHLVGFDGYGVRRNPFTLASPPEYWETLYDSGVMIEGSAAAIPTPLGIFVTSTTRIRVELGSDFTRSIVASQDGNQVVLSVGLVLGRYTTKYMTMDVGPLEGAAS